MSSIMSLADNATAINKYRVLYLVAFWTTLATFYATAIASESQPEVALTVCVCGAMVCVLKRMQNNLSASDEMITSPEAMAIATMIDRFLVEQGKFMIRLNGMLQHKSEVPAEVGVMLVALPRAGDFDEVTAALERLNGMAGAHVYQLDDSTVGIAMSGRNLNKRLSQLAASLREIATDSSEHINSGLAIATPGSATATDLLNLARASLSLARVEREPACAVTV